ncbi:MAG: hypothetical protein M3Q23_13405 [Actinomycetota bacterium]|nr:hypothetical protein [Actinomycetota bacterium]
MTVQTKVQAKGREALHAALGLGDLAVEKTKEFAGGVRDFDFQRFATTRQRKFTRTYNGLVKRGAALLSGVKRSQPVKRASEETKVARRRVKTAAKSVKKAAVANAEAARTAAEKVG